MKFDQPPTPIASQESTPVEKNEKGQVPVTAEDLKDEHVQEWLARPEDPVGDFFVTNKNEYTQEMLEFKKMLDEFEATYSLEELFAITDLTSDPDRKHPLRDLAKKALNPINEFRTGKISEGETELYAQWRKITNAVGIVNKGMVDHNR